MQLVLLPRYEGAPSGPTVEPLFVYATALHAWRGFWAHGCLFVRSHGLSFSATFLLSVCLSACFYVRTCFIFVFFWPGRPARVSAGGARAGRASYNQVCGRSREEHGKRRTTLPLNIKTYCLSSVTCFCKTDLVHQLKMMPLAWPPLRPYGGKGASCTSSRR